MTRPIVPMTCLLLAMGGLYAVFARKAIADPPPLKVMLLVALVTRAILIPSFPIQESDLYRYLWDGRVVAAGMDPYRFSPEEIDRFEQGGAAASADDITVLSSLVVLKRKTPALGEIFSLINNRAFPTVYPALAQALFFFHAWLVPAEWPAQAQVIAIKCFLVLLDMSTMALLMLLLRCTGKPASLALLYGWCPLVLKEIANSGHMDSLPTFFLVAALLAQASQRALWCGLGVGAAIASKLYAVFLFPVVLKALGWKRGLMALVSCLAIVALALLAFPEGAARRRETLVQFALGWENHDALFNWTKKAWSGMAGPAGNAPHLLALGTVLLALGGVLLIRLTRRATTRPPPQETCRSVFFLLAALFLLGPLGFPWYFLPCVALLPFVETRCWLLLPGLLMTYYLRFWFEYHFPKGTGFCGFPSGEAFFDEVVVSLEFALFYLLWIVEVCWARFRRRRKAANDDRNDD